MDTATQAGLLLHQMGMDCCDKGHPCRQAEGHDECHCNHSVTVEGIPELPEEEDKVADISEKIECKAPEDSCFT
jgi:hypothetical protein